MIQWGMLEQASPESVGYDLFESLKYCSIQNYSSQDFQVSNKQCRDCETRKEIFAVYSVWNLLSCKHL